MCPRLGKGGKWWAKTKASSSAARPKILRLLVEACSGSRLKAGVHSGCSSWSGWRAASETCSNRSPSEVIASAMCPGVSERGDSLDTGHGLGSIFEEGQPILEGMEVPARYVYHVGQSCSHGGVRVPEFPLLLRDEVVG